MITSKIQSPGYKNMHKWKLLLHKLIPNLLPCKRLHQIETKHQSRANVHFQPEHQINRYRFQSFLVLNEDDTRASEEDEENRVEEANCQTHNHLMDDCRNQESHKLCKEFVFSEEYKKTA